MERGMFGILVLSGLCNFVSSLPQRQYLFINEPKTWPEAQQYCRERYTDLATINNVKELDELGGLIVSGLQHVFLGLYESWGWSLSDTDDYKEGEVVYWNWASGQNFTDDCGSIQPTGEWLATDCGSSLNFSCYNGSATDISQRFTLGQGTMNWFDAQVYCRNQHTDLARVRNQLENEELLKIVNSDRVWIGLTRSHWVWSDGTAPSFTPWKPSTPNGLGDCGVLVNSVPFGMTDRSCDAQLPFFCYSDLVKKHLVRLKLTADDASVNMNDPAAMDSVLKWVEKKLADEGASEDVKLRWWKLPQKEKQTKTPQTHDVVCGP